MMTDERLAQVRLVVAAVAADQATLDHRHTTAIELLAEVDRLRSQLTTATERATRAEGDAKREAYNAETYRKRMCVVEAQLDAYRAGGLGAECTALRTSLAAAEAERDEEKARARTVAAKQHREIEAAQARAAIAEAERDEARRTVEAVHRVADADSAAHGAEVDALRAERDEARREAGRGHTSLEAVRKALREFPDASLLDIADRIRAIVSTDRKEGGR